MCGAANLTRVRLCFSSPSALSDVRNLNLWGNDLCDISVLRDCPNVEVVSLSVNSITSLADLAGCHRLRELYLRKNKVADLKQILYLTALPDLRILWLSENPVCAHPHYREFILAKLPKLQKLDNTDVTEEERDLALKKSGEGLLSPRKDVQQAAAAAHGGGSAFTFGVHSPRRGAGAAAAPSHSPRALASDSYSHVSSPRRTGGGGAASGPSSPLSGRGTMFSVRRASLAEDDGGSDLSDRERDREPPPVKLHSPPRRHVVPPLQFGSPAKNAPVLRSPVNHAAAQSARRDAQAAQLAAERAAEEQARKRTDALEEEIRMLRIAEKAERDAEAIARVRANGGGGGVQRSPRRAPAPAPSVAHSSPYSSNTSPRPSTARSAAPLSPNSAAHAAAYVSGSTTARGAGNQQIQTTNQQYGALSSRPASARPAAGEKPNPVPVFARGGSPARQQQPQGYASRPATAAPQSPRAPLISSAYEPLSPRTTYSMQTPAAGGGHTPPLPPPSTVSVAHMHHHAPASRDQFTLPPPSSSGVALTPPSIPGLSAPRTTQHNLLCATVAMLGEFDVAHLQWLQQEIQSRIQQASGER